MKVHQQRKQQGFKSQTKDGEMLTSRLFQLMSDVQSLTYGSSHYDPQPESQLWWWLDFRFGPDHHSNMHVYRW